jgi:hypothetical protein
VSEDFDDGQAGRGAAQGDRGGGEEPAEHGSRQSFMRDLQGM